MKNLLKIFFWWRFAENEIYKLDKNNGMDIPIKRVKKGVQWFGCFKKSLWAFGNWKWN